MKPKSTGKSKTQMLGMANTSNKSEGSEASSKAGSKIESSGRASAVCSQKSAELWVISVNSSGYLWLACKNSG